MRKLPVCIRRIAIGLMASSTLFAAACATDGTRSESSDPSLGETASRTMDKTREGLGDAALSPLEDLNLRRDEIPPLLADERSPYEVPGAMDLSCVDIAMMVAELDAILGNDFDYIAPERELSAEEKADRRAGQASDATLGYISSEARGFIPFRGAVRYVTGASAHDKARARALAIGAQRRAYLKGIGEVRGCPYPAAPQPLPEDDPEIVFKGDQPR